jgi:uridylate kinase
MWKDSVTAARHRGGPDVTVAPEQTAPHQHHRHRRVLLKLSGEVFGGGKVGLSPDVVRSVAKQIAQSVREGIETRVQTAITMGQVAEPYIPRRAIRHLEKGRVVIFGAGAGMPFFSTDTVSAQRALEIKCDAVLMSKNGVDGVYDSDPRTNPEARKLDEISYAEALQQGLRVVDAAAFSLCMENKLPMVVFGMEGEGNVVRALRGERIGTLVVPG